MKNVQIQTNSLIYKRKPQENMSGFDTTRQLFHPKGPRESNIAKFYSGSDNTKLINSRQIPLSSICRKYSQPQHFESLENIKQREQNDVQEKSKLSEVHSRINHKLNVNQSYDNSSDKLSKADIFTGSNKQSVHTNICQDFKRPQSIPLSNILRKYESEVKKIEVQNRVNNKKLTQKLLATTEERPLYEDDKKLKQEDGEMINSFQYKSQNQKVQKDDAKNLLESQQQSQVRALKEQLSQKQRDIERLVKQTKQSTKFIESIQKMKRVMEGQKPDSRKSEIAQKPQKQQQPDLHELWRWVKGLGFKIQTLESQLKEPKSNSDISKPSRRLSLY